MTSVLILAAGKGERMRSDLPKALQPLGGKSFLAHALAASRPLRPQKTIVVVGHKADLVRRTFASENGIRWALQKPQRGTAHAVLCAEGELRRLGRRPLLLRYVDAPFLRPETFQKMVALFAQERPSLVLLSATVENPTGYGRIVRNGSGDVERIVEENVTTPEEKSIREINVGCYVFDPAEILPELKQIPKNRANGEYYFTGLIERLRAAGKKMMAVDVEEAEDILGINSKKELAAAEAILQRRLQEGWMQKGVTFLSPQTIWISAETTLASDVVIHPGSVISGKSRVGRGSEILPHSVIDDSIIEAGCRIGPFAHLRPGTVVRAGAHVGNFVELKKTTIGKGAKANHLAYLGDTVIGPEANIGAGTITCNYDGLAKHRTVIGAAAFIGSDTQLVAPVRVGKNAWVGAGTTVTKDVPPGALALSRVEQCNIRNWRRKRR